METLFDKATELKNKFKVFSSHKNKIKALENYSSVGAFTHANYLELMKECLSEGFLEEKESEFLNYMIQKYELKYLDWSHKTKWLKAHMNSLQEKTQREKPAIEQQFDLFASRGMHIPKVHVPVELLIQQQLRQNFRRI